MIPFAVCLGGNVNVVVGSRIENCGYSRSWPKGSLSGDSFLLTTEPQFISEPVADNVNTLPNGSAVSIGEGYWCIPASCKRDCSWQTLHHSGYSPEVIPVFWSVGAILDEPHKRYDLEVEKDHLEGKLEKVVKVLVPRS